jgi:nucleoside-diphosphate-sugar epimerase
MPKESEPLSKTLILVGASSRAAAAIRAAIPGRETVGVARQGSHADVQLANYAEVPGEIPFAGATVVNCVGTDRGTADELDAINRQVPLAWANAARMAGARHFIQLSSFSVYAPTPVVRPDSALGPSAAYGRSKLAAEIALASLAGPEFTVSLLRVPILVGHAAAGGGDKLAALLKIIRRTRMIPRPAGSTRRAMLTYGGLGTAVAMLSERPAPGVLAAADPEPFSYELVAECAAAAHLRALRVPVPKAIQALARKAAPSIGNRLFESMELAEDFNLLRGSGGYAGLRETIAAQLSR